MVIFRYLLILLCSVSAVYCASCAYSNLQRFWSIRHLHHYRLYMSIAGLLLSLGTAGIFAWPQVWYVPAVALLAGLLVALREVMWAIRSAFGMLTAEHSLAVERRRFSQHDDVDRKLLSDLRDSLKSAGWAFNARRFRDAHRATHKVLAKLKGLQLKHAARDEQ